MTAADAPAVHELAVGAFNDLDERFGRPLPPPPATPEAAYIRFRHLVASDPGGAVVAERDGQLLGASVALIREGIWGLSMLAVRPGAQSGRIGSSLLSRALEYGASARGGIILSSDDPRAMRAYPRSPRGGRRGRGPTARTGFATARRRTSG
jgi:GNAT superfamily N-acetyltransferase